MPRAVRQRHRLGLELEARLPDGGDQAAAIGAAHRLGRGFGARLGDGQGRRVLLLRVQFLRPVVAGQGGRVAGAGRVRQLLQSFHEALGSLLARGHVARPVQPAQVGVEPDRWIGVLGMDAHDALIKLERLEQRRLRVGGCRLPPHEGGGRGQRVGVGADLEGVLGFGPERVFRRVEGDGLVGDEVEEGGPQRVGHVARFQKLAEVRGGDPEQPLLVGEHRLVERVHFPEQPGQVPGGEVLFVQVGGGVAVEETIPVPLVVVVEPLGQDDAEQRLDALRRLGDRLPEPAHLFLGVVAGGHGFHEDFFDERPERLDIGAVAAGAGVDLAQQGRGGFRQAVRLRLGDLLPERLTALAVRGVTGDAEKQNAPDQKKNRPHGVLLGVAAHARLSFLFREYSDRRGVSMCRRGGRGLGAAGRADG